MSRYKRIDRKFQEQMQLARKRVEAVWYAVNVLCPDKPVGVRTELAKTFLRLSEGCQAVQKVMPKITARQVEPLVWENIQCLSMQRGRCPMLLFSTPLADAINQLLEELER